MREQDKDSLVHVRSTRATSVLQLGFGVRSPTVHEYHCLFVVSSGNLVPTPSEYCSMQCRLG